VPVHEFATLARHRQSPGNSLTIAQALSRWCADVATCAIPA